MKKTILLMYTVICYLFGLPGAVLFRDCGSKGINIKSVKVHPCRGNPCILEAGTAIAVSINFKAITSVDAGGSKVHATMEGENMLGLLTPVGACAHLSPSCPIQAGGFYTYGQTTVIPASMQTLLKDDCWGNSAQFSPAFT